LENENEKKKCFVVIEQEAKHVIKLANFVKELVIKERVIRVVVKVAVNVKISSKVFH